MGVPAEKGSRSTGKAETRAVERKEDRMRTELLDKMLQEKELSRRAEGMRVA